MNARQRMDRLVRDLLHAYLDQVDELETRPGLLKRLDRVPNRTGQPQETGGAARTVPRSKPPAQLDAVDLAAKIRREARHLDAELRGSHHLRYWRTAIEALPKLAEQTNRIGRVESVLGTWQSTARTVLGFQDPAVDFPEARCQFCGQRGVIRARLRDMHAWCSNPGCVDPQTNRRPRYDHRQLLLLIRAAERGRR